MRGADRRQTGIFSYVSLEARVPQDHPLRPARVMVDRAVRAHIAAWMKVWVPSPLGS